MAAMTGVDARWGDLDRVLGQCLMMGFEGSHPSDQIRNLIENHYLGNVLLTAKNLPSAQETTRLVYELQKIAYDAGHPVPLSIALDQENGGVNSLFDDIYIRQFPSAMGLAATGSTELTYQVAKATAEEIAACGINWIMGPCLDTLSNARKQPLGVRAFCDDPQKVSKFGAAALRGFIEKGIMTLAKHWPSFGNLSFSEQGSQDVPTITDTIDELTPALEPFRNAVQQGVDAIMVGGCAMNAPGFEVLHACLSEEVVENLLRANLGFNGVVVSECLEMEALSQTIGIGTGTVMAIKAGCDVALLCRNPSVQQEAISGLKTGIENSYLSMERIQQAFRRVLDMKTRSPICTWEYALNPPGLDHLLNLQPLHTTLSTRAYNESISVIRDDDHLLPLTNLLEPDEELLVLTPLVKPLAASAASQSLHNGNSMNGDHYTWDKPSSVMRGERVFRELGRALARQRHGRVLHTSYTASGVRPVHENLISRASAVILLTADANRNLYQNGFTKHVSMICKLDQSNARGEKPLIVVSVSSPYDFALDPGTIGTLICTYDFTEAALRSLVAVLYGDLNPTGKLPGSISKSQKLHQSRQQWLVEVFNEDRDFDLLDTFIRTYLKDALAEGRNELMGCTANTFLLRNPDINETHFIVRNSSMRALYGFCATYYFKSTNTGVIATILVDSTRRRMSIGASLHNRAIHTLMEQDGIKQFQIGSRLPSVFLGIPKGRSAETKRLRTWFSNLGWKTAFSRTVCSLIARDLLSWSPPEGMTRSLANAQQTIEFDLVYGYAYENQILDHIKTSSRQGLTEMYKLALGDPGACGIIRAKRPSNGSIIGTLVLYNDRSQIADFVPQMRARNEITGGMSCPVISPAAGEYSTLLQSLVLLGMRQIRQQGCNACLLDCMDGDGNINSLISMGFEVCGSHEEISCDSSLWSSSRIQT